MLSFLSAPRCVGSVCPSSSPSCVVAGSVYIIVFATSHCASIVVTTTFDGVYTRFSTSSNGVYMEVSTTIGGVCSNTSSIFSSGCVVTRTLQSLELTLQSLCVSSSERQCGQNCQIFLSFCLCL